MWASTHALAYTAADSPAHKISTDSCASAPAETWTAYECSTMREVWRNEVCADSVELLKLTSMDSLEYHLQSRRDSDIHVNRLHRHLHFQWKFAADKASDSLRARPHV